MGKLGKLLIFTAAFGALFAWATNYSVPDGFNEPWKLKMFFAMLHTMSRIDSVVQYCGFDSIMVPDQNVAVPASVTRKEIYLEGVRTVIYRPEGVSGNLPAMVYYHGGGWIFGNPEIVQDYTTDLVKDLAITVISVDYRLAPKHRYPAAFEDSYKVMEYVINNAQELKIDSSKISLGGDSAGANLAAAVATKFRDEGRSNKIKMQLLLYPALQPYDFQMLSFTTGQDGLSRPEYMAKAWIIYAFGEERADLIQDMLNYVHVTEEAREEFIKLCGNSDLLTKSVTKPTNHKAWNEMQQFLHDPYYTPLVAKDLTNMPPSVIVTVDKDILKDEGYIYAQRLRDSGVLVAHHHVKACIHGIYGMKSMFPTDYQIAYDITLSDIKRFVV